MSATFRLSDIKSGHITPQSVWSEHYGEVLAIIRSWCHCDEDTAADISHDLYVIASRTGFLARWRPGGVPVPVWLIGGLRSYLSAVQRKKALPITDVDDLEQVGGACREFSDAECRAIAKQVEEKFSGRLHTKVFPLLRNEHSQVHIAKRCRVSRSRIGAVVEDIRTFLRNKV